MKEEEIVALLEKQVEGIEKKYRLGDEKANLTTLASINTVAIASVIVQGRKKPPPAEGPFLLMIPTCCLTHLAFYSCSHVPLTRTCL